MEKLRILWKFYYTFLKIGGFTLGGGYAMIPVIQREAVDIHKWATDEEMLDIFTLAESMPGVIGINAATALGIKVAGLPAALAGTLGMITIPIALIIIIAAIFENVMEYEQVQWAFFGVRAAVAALMASAVFRLAKNAVKDIFQIILFAGSIAAMLVFSVRPQYVILFCAVIAILYSLFGIKKKKGGDGA